LALRVIPTRIPSFEELGLPYAANWCPSSRGFVLVTGPTGSGKSTTLASIVNSINENRACHILTIEDPVEYVTITKRPPSTSAKSPGQPSFDRALRSALRETRFLLIGEMRDIDSIQIP